MQPFLQLSLYGVRLSSAERERILSERPATWKILLDQLESESTISRLEDTEWCRTRWQELDRWTKNYNLKWTFPGADDYPRKLGEMSDPPLILCYQGEPVWKTSNLISVVGSRDPMGDSVEWMRRHLLEFLLATDFSIASGGARGIDSKAHDLTLLADRPPVCFLPSGILNPYPQHNEPLFKRIIEAGGALISGFAPDARMQKGFFHARNRWIAAISDVTVIIEAQRKSGSFLTAKLALEEGRAICTLPVSPMSVRGLGNLDLIEAGVQPLRDAQDLKTFVERESRH